jgi:hypothetical protein
MDMVNESFHIFDIHLPISIEADESFDLELISISFDEVISCLICCSSSSIDRMIKDNNERLRILFLFFLNHLQGIVIGSIIDKD